MAETDAAAVYRMTKDGKFNTHALWWFSMDWFREKNEVPMTAMKVLFKEYDRYPPFGTVDMRELLLLIRDLGLDVSKATDEVKKFDTTGSRELDFDEFCTFAADYMQRGYVQELYPDRAKAKQAWYRDHHITAEHSERALRPMKNLILGLASIEFGGVPFFLWLGLCQHAMVGYIIVFATCMCVFRAKVWAIKKTSESLHAFAKYWDELKQSTFKLPFTGTETGIPSFGATLLSTIPQYTDNFTLCLAIGDIQAQWGRIPRLQDMWVGSWKRVLVITVEVGSWKLGLGSGTIATHVSLAQLLGILMIVGLVMHAYLFCVHWARSELGAAARVANLNLIADVVELAEGDFSAPAPSQATVPATMMPSSVASTLEESDAHQDNFHQTLQEGRKYDIPPGQHPAPSPSRADLAQPLLKDTENTGHAPSGPTPSAGSELEPPAVNLHEVGMGLDAETSEARQLDALWSRFMAKVVFGCNLRFWFKISLQVLLYAAGTHKKTMWISILNGVIHVALGTYPYVAKLLLAKSVPRKRKLLGLVSVFVCLAPFWGSLVRLSGIFLCKSHVFSFSAHGCEGEDPFGAPLLV